MAEKQVIYAKMRVGYDDYDELVAKLSNHLEVKALPVDYLICKAIVRQKAELVSRQKRATAEGKEPTEQVFTEL